MESTAQTEIQPEIQPETPMIKTGLTKKEFTKFVNGYIKMYYPDEIECSGTSHIFWEKRFHVFLQMYTERICKDKNSKIEISKEEQNTTT